MGFRACHGIPNMAPWYTEYLKLKEFEKTAETGFSVCPPSIPHPYSPKYNSHVRGDFHISKVKG